MTITFGPSKSHPSYNTFLAQNTPLGDPVFGGYLICKSGGGIAWIVAPLSTEVIRTWYCRDNAVTTAQANAACGDWFVPTIDKLQDPGYCCKTYWDSSPSAEYWSSTQRDSTTAWTVFFDSGITGGNSKTGERPARAFRCVTY
jgi:hypothetical protein